MAHVTTAQHHYLEAAAKINDMGTLCTISSGGRSAVSTSSVTEGWDAAGVWLAMLWPTAEIE